MFEPMEPKEGSQDQEKGQTLDKSESFLNRIKNIMRSAQFYGYFPVTISKGCKVYKFQLCSFIFMLSVVRIFSVCGLELALSLIDHKTNTLNQLLRNTLDISLKNDLFGNGLVNNSLARSFIWVPAVYFIIITMVLWKFSDLLTKLVEHLENFDSEAGIAQQNPPSLSIHSLAPLFAFISTSTYIFSTLSTSSNSWSIFIVLLLSLSFLYATVCSIFYELIFYHTANVINGKLDHITQVSTNKKISLSESIIKILQTFDEGFGGILLINLAALTIQWIIFWYLAVGTNLDDFNIGTIVSGGSFILSIIIRLYSIGSAGQSISTNVNNLSLSLLKYKSLTCSSANTIMDVMVVKEQVDVLEKQLENVKHVSACGMFHVNKKVLVTIVATTFTLLLFLYTSGSFANSALMAAKSADLSRMTSSAP